MPLFKKKTTPDVVAATIVKNTYRDTDGFWRSLSSFSNPS
jgi:hypothetical protein